MLMKDVGLTGLVLTSAVCCSGPAVLGNRAMEQPPSSASTCYRPDAEEFSSLILRGMTVKEAVAKGVLGSLDKEDIHAVIGTKTTESTACYERALAAQPHLSGRVTVQFVVAGDGLVQASRLESSTLSLRPTAICVAQRVCTWRFPKTTGGAPVVVTYPFNFAPAQGSP
jgi:hypothetical protein